MCPTFRLAATRGNRGNQILTAGLVRTVATSTKKTSARGAELCPTLGLIRLSSVCSNCVRRASYRNVLTGRAESGFTRLAEDSSDVLSLTASNSFGRARHGVGLGAS